MVNFLNLLSFVKVQFYRQEKREKVCLLTFSLSIEVDSVKGSVEKEYRKKQQSEKDFMKRLVNSSKN